MSNETKKGKRIDRMADDSGVSIVIVDERGSERSVSNNNSICARLMASPDFAPRCAEFCGKAFEKATAAGKMISYECHAGLECRAVPLSTGEKQLVAIVGRTFVKAANYKNATTRAITGDWRKFPPTRFFENVLLTGSPEKLDSLAVKLEEMNRERKETLAAVAKAKFAAREQDILEINERDEIAKLVEQFNNQPHEPVAISVETAPDMEPRYAAEEIAAWRSLFGSLLHLEYKTACERILEFLGKRYDLSSLIWLERKGNQFERVIVRGELSNRPVKIGIAADDVRLAEAARSEMPLEMKERQKPGSVENRRLLSLFPIAVGGDIRSALAVGNGGLDDYRKYHIARFCQTVASELEILRLRAEVSRRDVLAKAVRRFNENLKKVDAEDFWQHLTQIAAELLQSERASLLMLNEKTDALQSKAAVGARADLTFEENVGDRVSRIILERMKPVVVADVRKIALAAAPPERKYKTDSFVSYPITIGGRGIAVLNFTDKVGGDAFNEHDLDMLRAIAPQIAVAIDRATLRDKAGEYAQLSVTDPLTGLLNRRYLEERLTEEIKRSNRNGDPVSFMMLDVDEFKAYNDRFGHPAGDEALELVGQILKDTLRGADIASRYGGEEFAVLLPQTTSDEAETIAERLRGRIETSNFPKRKVTVSIGIASRSSTINSVRDLISAADKALYQAKRAGRNNVRIYGGDSEENGENIH